MNDKRFRMKRRWLAGIVILLSVLLLGGQGPHTPQYALGDIPLDPETYQKHLKVRPMDMAEALETSYDARDYGWVTPAKDQKSCGSCWAFASVGAMESHMLKAYGAGYEEDLSEQQQVSCNTAMWGCSGGNSSAIRYWEPTGPLYELDFPYTASDSTSCVEDNYTQLGYRVIDWHTVGSNDFKNSLYTYGPSYWRYTVYSDFFTFWNYGNPGDVYVNQSSSYEGGHAVLLIGWDDAKGAYLCKNSWGGGGPNNDGTFWISYSGHYNNLSFGMANFSLTSLTCSSDAECNDGLYCNGTETCADGACQAGRPPACDDGEFCTGTEFCDEVNDTCASTGDPCGSGTVCTEATETCDLPNCGNGLCDEGEDCTTCSADCDSGAGGGTCGACFKGKCDGVCHPVKEGPECADCAPSWCCGDGVCEGDETVDTCPLDCGCTVTGCDDGNACTTGTCDPDTGVCSYVWPSCGLDDGCCGPDCGESDPDCGPTCAPKGDSCDVHSDCCSNKCRAGTCK